MFGEHSALYLILHASLVVQLVMALLVAASILSWAIILQKSKVLKKARADAEAISPTCTARWSAIPRPAWPVSSWRDSANSPGCVTSGESAARSCSRAPAGR